MISVASAASASGATEGLRAGNEPLLEEGRHLFRLGAGGLGDVGPAHRRRIARHRDRVLEADRHTLGVEPLDDLLRPGDALALRALTGRRDHGRVHPVAQHVHVIDAAVDARHLRRGDQHDPSLARGLAGLGHSIDPVVVGEREGRHARLHGGRHHARGRELAVGVRRMALQVDHRRGEHWVSAKADYAVRAAVEMAAAGDEPVKGEKLAEAQDIPSSSSSTSCSSSSTPAWCAPAAAPAAATGSPSRPRRSPWRG